MVIVVESISKYKVLSYGPIDSLDIVMLDKINYYRIKYLQLSKGKHIDIQYNNMIDTQPQTQYFKFDFPPNLHCHLNFLRLTRFRDKLVSIGARIRHVAENIKNHEHLTQCFAEFIDLIHEYNHDICGNILLKQS
jgi:hypothetical protein